MTERGEIEIVAHGYMNQVTDGYIDERAIVSLLMIYETAKAHSPETWIDHCGELQRFIFPLVKHDLVEVARCNCSCVRLTKRGRSLCESFISIANKEPA